MSKKALKEILKDLNRGQLEELILEIYSSGKEAKEYLDFYCDPNEEKKADEIREMITKEFFPPNRRRSRCRFSPAKREIKKLQRWGASPRVILDLLLHLVETACKYDRHNYCSEATYKSMANNLKTLLEYAGQHGLYPEFQRRIDLMHKVGMNWGYGVYDIYAPAYEGIIDSDQDL